jgi:Cu(I)/Ag(I) efflux system membrane fusion protein
MSTNTKNNTIGNHIKPIFVGMIIGGIITFGAINFLTSSGNSQVNNTNIEEEQPLYWVAPMDANYRRDKAGKSPMGMDLVPVYDDGGKGPDEGPGTIWISPDVVNNLGVRTAMASFKPLHTEINTVGYVKYNEDKIVHIHPRVQGWIEKLYVKSIGDSVKKNQPLYEIYSPELVNAQEEFLLALDRNNKRLIIAAQNRLSALELPKSVIEQIKKTKKIQQTITFYSPQNGVVKNLKIREGFFVKPGATLISIADLSEVWIEAEVFERQANQVKKAMPVTMTLDYLPGKTFKGQVDFIYPTLDANTRTVKVRMRFTNVNREFKPNMFAKVTIHSTTDEQALLIPKEALIRTGKQDRVVLALGEGSFKSVEVSVGRYDSENVEILQGINAGEQVVSSAQFLLDSESSKSSDFKRMHYDEEVINETPTSVWVSAQIESLMPNHKMLTLKHDAIPEWDWPEMTMDFIATDSVDFSSLKQGLNLQVEVSKNPNGDYQISHIDLSQKTDMKDINMPKKNDKKPVSIDNASTIITSDEALSVDHSNH